MFCFTLYVFDTFGHLSVKQAACLQRLLQAKKYDDRWASEALGCHSEALDQLGHPRASAHVRLLQALKYEDSCASSALGCHSEAVHPLGHPRAADRVRLLQA